MEFIKRNITALIMLLFYTVVLITFMNKLDARAEQNKIDIIRVESTLRQVTFENMSDKFVTRKEYETQLTDVKNDLNEIKRDIKKILQRTTD